MTCSPLQEILPAPTGKLRLFVKRDELNHPLIQGNKWRKLAPFIPQIQGNKAGVISFGGPFSNHLHAFAAAAAEFRFPAMAVVRGLTADPDNPTLAFARACGVELYPVSKADYEKLKKAAPDEIFRFLDLPPRPGYIALPEGADTPEALVGCMDLAVEIRRQLPENAGNPVYICVPAGTGCTAAGVVAGAQGWAKTLIFPAAPYGVDRSTIVQKLTAAGKTGPFDFDIVEDMQPPKFAAMTPELLDFVRTFKENTGILLDPVYTSKMMARIFRLCREQFFPPGSCLVAVHTGGLQGWSGFGVDWP